MGDGGQDVIFSTSRLPLPPEGVSGRSTQVHTLLTARSYSAFSATQIVKSNDHEPSWDEILAEHSAMAVLAAWRVLGQKQDTEDVVQESWLECFQLWTSSSVRGRSSN